MAPKQGNHKCENFKIGFNGLAMVDDPRYNPNDDNRRHSLGYLAENTFSKVDKFSKSGSLHDKHYIWFKKAKPPYHC